MKESTCRKLWLIPLQSMLAIFCLEYVFAAEPRSPCLADEEFKTAEAEAYTKLVEDLRKADQDHSDRITRYEEDYRREILEEDERYRDSIVNCMRGNLDPTLSVARCQARDDADHRKEVGILEQDREFKLQMSRAVEAAAKQRARHEYEAKMVEITKAQCQKGFFRATHGFAGIVCSLEKSFSLTMEQVKLEFTPKSAWAGHARGITQLFISMAGPYTVRDPNETGEPTPEGTRYLIEWNFVIEHFDPRRVPAPRVFVPYSYKIYLAPLQTGPLPGECRIP